MEALSVLVKKNPIICLVVHFSSLCLCPGSLLETDTWAVSIQGWHALFLLMFLWLLTNNKLLKMVLVAFRDRDLEGQVSVTPSYIGLTIKSTSNQGSASETVLWTPVTLLLVTSLNFLMNLPGPLCQWGWSKVLNVCLNAPFVLAVSLCHTSRCWEQKARPHVVSATVAPWQQAEQCQAKSLHRSYHRHWRGL